MFTQEQLAELLNQAKELAKQTKSSSTNIGDSIKNKLYESSSKIQSLLNTVLAKGGVVTESEFDALDEQVRLAKKQLLESKSKQTNTKIAIYAAIGIAVFGTLWFLTKRQTK